jgi:glycine/D-amino acid oxidase-like deaminating enzyme/nitrite reductase/ring-hydroxylating ferredoxin subunit
MEPKNTSEEGKLTSGKNLSCWVEPGIQPTSFEPLKENLHTEVVIVGGGLAGITTAYCLLKAGKKIVLVEDGLIGSGETGRTTAHIVTALDDRYYDLEKTFGEPDTKIIAQSHSSAIDFIEKTVKLENIDCDFERVDGYLFLNPTDKKDSLEREFHSASKAGLDIRESPSPPGMLTNEGKSLCFKNQAQFHPINYLIGLCAAIERMGGIIYTETHASEINHEGIKTRDGFSVRADYVVIATNTPVNNKYAMHLKQKAFRTYVIGALVKKGVLPRALWWDTGNFNVNANVPPYHYVRLQKYNEEFDLLISGGEDHQTGDPKTESLPEETIYNKLEKWTRDHFPVEEVVYQWSGQVMEPMDAIAFIGRNPFDKKNVFIITGDSGNGMTHCTIGGMLITDLITGTPNEWERIYDPSRFTLNSSGPFFSEVMQTVLGFFRGEPDLKESIELSELKNGEAKLMELQKHKCGVFRDEDGHLHIVSAKCTHLGCTPSWNKSEQTWDCPCHGSRFTYDGKVINGPANDDLPSYSENIFVPKKEINLQDE